MKEATATGLLHAGKLRLDDKVGFADDLTLVEDGSIVLTVTHATPKGIRGSRAKRYYYGVVLKMIRAANAEPIDVDELHEFFSTLFLARPITIVNPQTGESDTVQAPRRSSTLEGDAFWDYVNNVRGYARRFYALEIPDPDPAWRLNQTEAA
ncbi:MAG TPA: hypothetical protein VKR23_16065 [Gaiellaceae bacterium]|nr:hypothetical protein [Gaiellaceae bacterium]